MGDIVDIKAWKEQQEAERMTRLEFEARKIYLGWYLDAVHEIRSCEMELAELEADYGPSARALNGMPGGKKTDGSDRIIRRIEHRAQLQAQIERCRARAVRMRDEVGRVIETTVGGNLRSVLRYVYINDMDLAQVAMAMNYGQRRVTEFHGIAIRRIKPPRHRIQKIKAELMEEHPEWAETLMKAM